MTDAQKETGLIGEIGERYVMYHLSRLGITSIKLPPEFDFDIYTSTDIRIEVKTSVVRSILDKSIKNGKEYTYEVERFGFHNYSKSIVDKRIIQDRRDRDCDFFVLVCMDEDFKIIKSYVIPKKEIGTRRHITIFNDFDRPRIWDKFLEKWDQIILNTPIPTHL